MAAPDLTDQLVVAISSRALFDFEEENQVFETADDRAYMTLQLERLDAAGEALASRTAWCASCCASTTRRPSASRW